MKVYIILLHDSDGATWSDYEIQSVWLSKEKADAAASNIPLRDYEQETLVEEWEVQ